MGAVPNGRSKGRRTQSERRELALRALEMRRDGQPYDVIAKELGCTVKYASRHVNNLLNERAVEGVDQYRATVEERYDDLVRKLREILKQPDASISQRLEAIGKLAAIEEKRVRLLGLAIPVKQVIELQNPRDDGEDYDAV
ncbi:hypothetical protein [Glycomyces sp. MUSA5-2]|uniref:hypothetical protein n=1 Tax=Glycomyces sp. MUSA5-2 TaxID=2053002 RepID=UPI00300915B2